MRGDITDNLNIANITPTKLINLLSINPKKIKMFFPLITKTPHFLL